MARTNYMVLRCSKAQEEHVQDSPDVNSPERRCEEQATLRYNVHVVVFVTHPPPFLMYLSYVLYFTKESKNHFQGSERLSFSLRNGKWKRHSWRAETAISVGLLPSPWPWLSHPQWCCGHPVFGNRPPCKWPQADCLCLLSLLSVQAK